MLDGLLWDPEDPEPASLAGNQRGEATKAGADESQTEDLPGEDHGITFLVCYHLGAEVRGDGTQEVAMASVVGAEELH